MMGLEVEYSVELISALSIEEKRERESKNTPANSTQPVSVRIELVEVNFKKFNNLTQFNMIKSIKVKIFLQLDPTSPIVLSARL